LAKIANTSTQAHAEQSWIQRGCNGVANVVDLIERHALLEAGTAASKKLDIRILGEKANESS
jgi:hypothetical protein